MPCDDAKLALTVFATSWQFFFVFVNTATIMHRSLLALYQMHEMYQMNQMYQMYRMYQIYQMYRMYQMYQM